MTEVKKDTYVLTIENSETDTKITSVKNDDKELLNEDNPIDLENEQNAIQQLNSAINPVAADTSSQADTSSPQTPSLAEEAEEAAKKNLLNTQLEGKFSKYKLETLMNRLNQQGIKDQYYSKRQQLLNYINDQLEKKLWDNADANTITNDINNFYFKDVQKEKRGKYFHTSNRQSNLVLGGNHHTRKRTHKPRNAKSNTRKGHIYRTNRRRTHGKSSAHGKKQTRRIVNR